VASTTPSNVGSENASFSLKRITKYRANRSYVSLMPFDLAMRKYINVERMIKKQRQQLLLVDTSHSFSCPEKLPHAPTKKAAGDEKTSGQEQKPQNSHRASDIRAIR